MDKNFVGLLNTQVQAINKSYESGESKKSIDHLLKTVILLLSGIKISDDLLKTYDEDGMLTLFSYYSRFAEYVCNFYQESKEILDLEIMNDEKEKELESATRRVFEIKTSIRSIEELKKSLEENNVLLLKQERYLSKKNDEYKKLNEKIVSLEKVKENVSDDILKTLKCEVEELNKTIKQNQKIKSELESQIKELENTHQTLSKSIVKANTIKNQIEETIIDTINAKIETIREIYTKHSVELDRKKTEIEDYKRQYSQLDAELMKLDQEHSRYNLHLGENSSIVTRLKEYDISSINNLFTNIDRHRNAIETELERFDKILRDIIIEQERINNEIDISQEM